MSTLEGEDAETPNEPMPEVAYIAQECDTICTICSAEFLDFEDLEQHLEQVHHGKNTCQFCETSYSQLDKYAHHIIKAHFRLLKCCRFCTKIFTDLNKFKLHEQRHERKRSVGCSQCPSLFTKCKDLQLHEKQEHDNKIDGVFLKCMVELTAYLKLSAPTVLQDENNSLECISCSFTTFDLSTYVNHLKDDKCNAYVCNDCGNIFKKKKALLKHVQIKNKCYDIRDYGLVKCDNCSTKVLKITMRAHKKTCKVIYKCQTCDVVFKNIEELSYHQAREHPIELDIKRCKFCLKEFVSDKVLNNHIEKFHKPKFHQYKYQCKMCEGSYFTHPQKLFAHYFRKHKEFEPYTCKVCDTKFRIRKRFTLHIKLDHKSVGFVEFDDQYNVFFTANKSEHPFIPKCVIPNFDPDEYSKQVAETDLETEIEKERKQKKKSKRKLQKKAVVTLSSSDEEDAEPLHVIKKRVQRKTFQKHYSGTKISKLALSKRRQFTCIKCNKYCYTYQNFQNHMKMHSKYQEINCIKCAKTFANKKSLNEHIAADHTTSKLIETLKTVLERKQGETQSKNNSAMTNSTNINDTVNSSVTQKRHYKEIDKSRFLKTIKRVKIDKAQTPAKIEQSDNISAKKFIENFMPDINETKEKESITITRYNSPYYRPSSIKLHKFVPQEYPTEIKLKMPERFKEEDNDNKVQVQVKVVQKPIQTSQFDKNESYSNFEDDDNFDNRSIPDIAQEVMLEESDEPPKILKKPKIIIPKLPQGYPNNIHIATLTTQAPFYKIIKVSGPTDEPLVIDTEKMEEEKEAELIVPDRHDRQEDEIRLADGTKLVTANPLAHLLGGKPLNKILEKKHNKYYTPVLSSNVMKGLIADALLKLDKPHSSRKKK